MGVCTEFLLLMQGKSEIEELWIGATDDEAIRRVNNAILQDVFYCESCGFKMEDKVNRCDPCINCGNKECE